MVKVGDTVKWENVRTKEKLSGKVTGTASKGKFWRIEKGGKRYYVEKSRVKKGVVKKKKVEPKKAPAPAKKPKKTPAPDKDTLQTVMGVMAEVAKEKGKSTKKEVDEKVALDKKLQKGKLTNKDFKELMFDNFDTMEHIFGFEDSMSESQGYNMDYWYAKVTKRDIFSWDDLTDNQSERLQEIMMNDIKVMTKKKMKSFYDNSVKGKKFKSFKELKDLFFDEYDEAIFNH